MVESKRRPENVYWLGGSPCAGKSSVSEILARRFALDVYHVDEAFERHAQSFDPSRQPALAEWCASSWDERWMQPPADLVRNVIACYGEHFALILKDVLAAAGRKLLLVEGAALLPGLVAGLLPERSHAIWMIPSADFQREHYSRRQWARGVVGQCKNPEAAFDNWMERDARFAEWVEAEASALNLRTLKVGAGRTIEDNASAVAAHFRLRVG
jgi:2-phosphoglycerate kinase